MYPWEHLLLGYLVVSLYTHIRYRSSPTAAQTIAAVIGSQAPDLVDKPLAWSFGLVETGYAVGHSIFVAPGVILATAVLSRRVGRERSGVAFVLAYLSHLASDIVYPLAHGRGIEPRVVLWPIASPPGSDIDGKFLDRTLYYFQRFYGEMTAGELTWFVAFQLSLAGGVLLLWMYDGAPVANESFQWLRRRIQDLLAHVRVN